MIPVVTGNNRMEMGLEEGVKGVRKLEQVLAGGEGNNSRSLGLGLPMQPFVKGRVWNAAQTTSVWSAPQAQKGYLLGIRLPCSYILMVPTQHAPLGEWHNHWALLLISKGS